MAECFWIGVICIAISIGSMTSPAWGWLTFGVFCCAIAFCAAMGGEK